MKRVLFLSGHFPPDSSAGTHRARLLAPHLARYGWTPTVVTVDERACETRLDGGLLELLPPDLTVLRAPAWQASWTRRLGVGDLGLRAWSGLLKTATAAMKAQPHDVIYITIGPNYPATLGPILKKRFGAKFVLDYQDPWVGAWGERTGPGGQPDFKSRMTRRLAERLEPWTLAHTDAVTSVSARTYQEARARVAHSPSRFLELPIGCEPADFEWLRSRPRPNPDFNTRDGLFHICYVGTLLPLGHETLRAFLSAVAQLKKDEPSRYQKLRIHFFGTSNQSSSTATPLVLPHAEALGVAEVVSEIAPRLDYLDATQRLLDANAILLMGTSEPHYTASKIFPALLSHKPLLAIYRRESTVTQILARAAPASRVVAHGAESPLEHRTQILEHLQSLMSEPKEQRIDNTALKPFFASSLAAELAALFDQIT